MVDNINDIISDSLKINKNNLLGKVRSILKEIKNQIFLNKDLFLETCKIDIEKSKGYKIDFDIVNNIFSNLENENMLYGDVIVSQKDDDKKIIYGKEIMDYGNVVVISDGDFYVILEMAIRNIMAGNSSIFCNDGFMYGTNKLLLELINTVLEKYNISKYFLQIYITDNYDTILNNFANIDLIICIGNRELQNNILMKSKNKVILSGYDNYDIYIEDKTNLDFISGLLKHNLRINIYALENIEIFDNVFVVNDIDEAIAQINYNGNRYSASIFTSSSENASKFIKEIKSKIVTVNASPTIERILDIKQSDLYNLKTIIYPDNFKYNDNIKFDI